MTRSDAQILAENKRLVALGLPKVVLTREEREERFGDTTIHQNPLAYDDFLKSRLLSGLPLSRADAKRARAYIKASPHL
tara:strand:+ start:345 stop:581 length:237 start_codon:yes stop_codon:yes gene_type:complete